MLAAPYERQQAGPSKPKEEPISAEAARDAAQDRIHLAALRIVASLLPQPDRPTASVRMYEFLPHASLAALIELSTLPDLLATLLRNDSVPEWQRRSDVYFAMLDVLGLLGGCEATLGCLFGQRREKKFTDGIGKWIHGQGEIAWAYEGGEPDPTTTKGKRKGKGKGKGKAAAAATSAAKGKKRKADAEPEPEPTFDRGKVVFASP